MMQRTQLSTALTILGVAGFLTAVGATGFSVVTARNLSAAAEPLAAPVAEKEPLDLDLQPRPLKPAPAPQPVVPVLPIAAPHAAQQAVSFRRVPAFTEIEAKAEAALNSPITVSFKDTDLTSALEKLSELAGVSVRQAAQKGLNEILQENDAKPLTLEFSNQPLRTVLAGVYKVALELKSDDSLGQESESQLLQRKTESKSALPVMALPMSERLASTSSAICSENLRTRDRYSTCCTTRRAVTGQFRRKATFREFEQEE